MRPFNARTVTPSTWCSPISKAIALVYMYRAGF
jgi:hypothetical protein